MFIKPVMNADVSVNMAIVILEYGSSHRIFIMNILNEEKYLNTENVKINRLVNVYLN